MIEVELRGYVPAPRGGAFREYLDAHAESKITYHEVAMFCNTEDVPNFGSFASGMARIQMNQKRFADGTIHQKIKLKTGVPKGHGRGEYELALAEPGLVGFFEILKRLGVTQASFRTCERCDYSIGDIAIALKYDHPVGDHFEAEIQCETEGEVASAREKIFAFLTPFSLSVWEPEEYKQIILASGSKAPYMPFDEGVAHFDIR